MSEEQPVSPGYLRVYHYLAGEHALSDIRMKRLKIATYDNLNDPFELRSFSLRDRQLRAALNETKAEMARTCGMLCFSLTWRNPVLWSHYGDRHRGICLGFDVLKDLVQKVRYESRRRSEPTAINERTVQALMLTKYKDWAYEREVRAFVHLDERDEQTSLYFYDFGQPLRLVEVILGPLCAIDLQDVDTLLRAYAEPVRVSKSRLAFGTYNVVKDQRFRQPIQDGTLSEADNRMDDPE